MAYAKNPSVHEFAMKPRLSHQRIRALTKIEVVVIVAALAILAALFLPALATAKRRPSRINCVSELKQIGIAFRIWEGDHNDKYPMQVPVADGGTMELAATGNVAATFLVMSNELSTPRFLVCFADTKRIAATNFSAGLNNSNISYFIGVEVTNEINPQMLLVGDDNFAIGGMPVKSGLLQLSTNASIAWTAARHQFAGNIGMADGSVQQVTTDGLQKLLQQTGSATNRLAIP